MQGLKYLLLCALTTAVTSLPAEGEGVINGPQPPPLKFYDGKGSMHVEGEVNGALRKRWDVVDFCRIWGQSSE